MSQKPQDRHMPSDDPLIPSDFTHLGGQTGTIPVFTIDGEEIKVTTPTEEPTGHDIPTWLNSLATKRKAEDGDSLESRAMRRLKVQTGHPTISPYGSAPGSRYDPSVAGVRGNSDCSRAHSANSAEETFDSSRFCFWKGCETNRTSFSEGSAETLGFAPLQLGDQEVTLCSKHVSDAEAATNSASGKGKRPPVSLSILSLGKAIRVWAQLTNNAPGADDVDDADDGHVDSVQI